MTRVKRGECARQRRKKLLHFTRSFSGVHSRLFRQAKQQRFKALRSAFVGRKELKRESRRLWIQRIQCGLSNQSDNSFSPLKYNTFIHLLKEKNIFLNRKILAQMVLLDPKSFHQLFETIQN